MILLESAFSLITPDPGLLVWSTIIFGILWILLAKFAFKPIIKSLNDRSASIKDSLDEAKKAREEVANMKADNEAILQKAREERSAILQEANKAKETIVAEAKNEAQKEGAKMIAKAKEEIEAQKNAVMTEMKNASAKLSLDIAEKVLSSELANKSAQEKLVSELISKASLN